MSAEAFVDFLTKFKSSSSASEASATSALQDLNIDDGDLSDEYDFMDDVEGNDTSRRRTEREPKLKYMNLLQEVANRTKSEITVELDDLDVVRYSLNYTKQVGHELGGDC